MKRTTPTKKKVPPVATKQKKSSKKTTKIQVVQTTSSKTRTLGPTGFDKVLHFLVTGFFCFLKYLLVFMLGVIASLVAVSCILFFLYVRSVSNSSEIPIQRLLRIGFDGRHSDVLDTNGRFSLLILGTDALSNRDDTSKLTDTVMVVSVSPEKGKIDTFSIPRDLWIASQSAKINALYTKDSMRTRQIVTSITGVSLSKQVVIDIDTVGKLIDAVGGIDVSIERSFVDYRFPRSDVDVRVERNFDKLYETVAFTKGTEHMSGDRALRYIRSRHSSDVIEGTDDARVRRQQQVISAILAKSKDPLLARNPEQIGALMKIFEEDVESDLSLEELSALGWEFLRAGVFPQFVAHQFTIKEVDKNGVLTHPARFPGGAWVYLPVDTTYTQMKQTVETWLKE